MKIDISFKNQKVQIVGGNPKGPNPAIDLTNAQAISLARTILVKLDAAALSK